MEQRYFASSIFATNAYEDFVKLTIESYFKTELSRQSETEGDEAPVQPISMVFEAATGAVSHRKTISQLLKVLQCFARVSQTPSAIETLASTALELLFDRSSGHFKPRNNSTVGTR